MILPPPPRTALPGARLLATLAALALALLVSACGPGPGGAGPGGAPGGTASPPLLSQPQLKEDQEAMPELGTFDALAPSQSPAGLGAPLGSPGAPPLGSGALLGQ